MEKINEKQTRFKTVAGRRVQKILDDLESLSNCANTNTYEYSEDDVKKMKRVINEKISFLWAAFDAANSKSSKQVFKF